MKGKYKVTKEGFEKISKELQILKETDRPKAVGRLQKARDMGDLSENSAYTAAREKLSFIDSRILELEAQLKESEVVSEKCTDGTICLGSVVKIKTDGTTTTYTIVGEIEADITQNQLSDTSPIGKALVGRKKGDKVEIKIPAGKVIYTVLEVK